MSLFGSIQLANNSLQATQIGLQVVGQNIANANTPGYIREETNYTPAATQKIGNLTLGLGVKVDSITQKIDTFLEERLRGATSDQQNTSTQADTFSQLEGLLNALGDSGLDTSMNNFFSSINDVLNQPESASVRNLAMLKGQTLAGDIHSLSQRVRGVRSDLNNQVSGVADDINRLTSQIRTLNIQISQSEGGSVSKSDAVGLRDQRNLALSNLSKLIDVRVSEQPSGAVTVYSGGDFLVFDGQSRAVKTTLSSDRGLSVAQITIADTGAPVQFSSGKLAGLIASRDRILGGFLDKLDSFSATLASEFNKVYASGQGLNGFTTVTAQNAVDAADKPLDAAGLKFPPVNGSFRIEVHNTKTKLTVSTDINVALNGLDNDTTLNSLAAQLNAVSGVSATVSSDGKLTIKSASGDQDIAFAKDTSGVLTGLGINTFFTGTDAQSLAVNADVVKDPGKFAASQNGIGQDTLNAVALAQFIDKPLESRDGKSIANVYAGITAETTQASSVAKSVAQGFQVYADGLGQQSMATSGVNLDEEAVKMITLQRTYQASAKYISAINELLQVLVNL